MTKKTLQEKIVQKLKHDGFQPTYNIFESNTQYNASNYGKIYFGVKQ